MLSALQLLSETEQKSFFHEALERGSRAAERIGAIEQDVAVGPTIVRFIFAGEELRSALLPALGHLGVDRVDVPDLTVHVWESERSGIDLPPAPCPAEGFSDRGEIWTMPSRRVRSAFQWSECSLSMIDLDDRVGLYWVRSAEALPYWTLAAPFRGLLNWWMEANGGQLLHAAAIGSGEQGVLITGKGGTGKSTTALASLQQGLLFLGDDYVIVTSGERPTVWSLYCTAKIDEASMERFEAFSPRLRRFGDDQKAVISLDPGHPSLARSLELKAILTPCFTNRAQTSLAVCPRGAMRDAALFTTLCQLPHVGQQTSDFIDGLLDRLPAYSLRLGSEIDAVPDTIAALLQSHSEMPLPTENRPPMPLLSVVIPVHNGARFLAEAVESVVTQNYAPLDIIVVDDGSLDEIDAAVASLPVDVRFFKQLQAGPAAARNRGILNAAGDFVAFLDVDDLWPSNTLRPSMECLLADETIDVVIGRGQLMIRNAVMGEWQETGDPEHSFPHSIPAALFRRAVFRTVGLFDEKLRFGEDTDWFLRADDAGGRVERVTRTTLLVRRHDANMTLGKSGVELVPLRLFKNVLERRRARSD
jgi:hypothetical protein